MNYNNQFMATYTSPYSELDEVVAWLDAYRHSDYEPRYLCEGCISQGNDACRHYIDITEYTEAQLYAHIVSMGRTEDEMEWDTMLFRSIRTFQLSLQYRY